MFRDEISVTMVTWFCDDVYDIGGPTLSIVVTGDHSDVVDGVSMGGW